MRKRCQSGVNFVTEDIIQLDAMVFIKLLLSL